MKDHSSGVLLAIRVLFVALLAIVPLTAFGAQQDSIEDHIVETETGIYYVVQPGDTLWDLSRKFSDSPWLWPDLWKENQDIPNPHLIYPGQRIRIYRRQDIDKLAGPTEAAPQPVVGKTFEYKNMKAVGFIRYPELPPSGVIFHVQEPKDMIRPDDIVYISPEIPGDFTAGGRLTVYRTLKPLRERQTNEINGVQHLLTGVLEVTEVRPDLVTARVVDAFRPIAIDDKVTPFLERPATIPIQESLEGLEGRLIFSEEHLDMIAEQNLAFIDKGRKDGILTGQFYTIFDREEAANAYIQLPKYKVGEVLVLHIEDDYSTVLVTRSNKEAAPDTGICTPF